MKRNRKDPRKAIERYHARKNASTSLRENKVLKEDTPEKKAKVSDRLTERSEKAKNSNIKESVNRMEKIVSNAVESESITLEELKKLNYELDMFKGYFND